MRLISRCCLAVEGIPNEDQGECGDNDRCGPGDYVEAAGVGVFAHELVLVDELQHEDKDQGEKDAVEDLRENAEFDQRKVRDEDDGCSCEEQKAVEPVEEFGFTEAFVEAAPDAEAFAAGGGGGG